MPPSHWLASPTPTSVHAVLAALMILPPYALLLAAFAAWRRSPQDDLPWRLAQIIQVLTFGLAAACLAAAFALGSAVISPLKLPFDVRLDVLGSVMMTLIAFIGWVIVRYSRHYLAGDPGRNHYLAWLCLTIAGVWLLVTVNNLLLLVLAWSGISFTLHQLLTYYAERPAALLAAHKKFLLSRAADVLNLAATFLVFQNTHTLGLDRIAEAAASHGATGMGLQAAACLFAASAILKCAQLPFHGWVLQVMEAPTPVSALLHAGIVNIGGFVLLRITGLLEASPSAQLLLVVAGSLTAMLASLVMMTRVSIKVMLAWSTCAQMGFMLLEIGLGAYPLALLHLVAHSLYKAHAFLAAGETVAMQARRESAPLHPMPGRYQRALTAAGLVCIVALTGIAAGLKPVQEPALWVLGGALLCGFVPLADSLSGVSPWRRALLLATTATGLTLLYCIWHRIFSGLIPPSPVAPALPGLLFAGACVVGLTVLQQAILTNPAGQLSRWLHPRAFAGFHLDEIFTRLTLQLWPAPARYAANAGSPSALHLATSQRENA